MIKRNFIIRLLALLAVAFYIDFVLSDKTLSEQLLIMIVAVLMGIYLDKE